ncbi:hypothetical protein OSTOST_15565 [Ostertagia ostertagi]
MRFNRRFDPDEDLISLPQKIAETLVGFGEDLLGLGNKELTAAPGVDASVLSSSFYMQLGQSEEERSKEYERLCEERKKWRFDLFRALQRALRDLRLYVCVINADGSVTWIPGNRKSKPTTDGNTDSAKRRAVDNNTEDSIELM